MFVTHGRCGVSSRANAADDSTASSPTPVARLIWGLEGGDRQIDHRPCSATEANGVLSPSSSQVERSEPGHLSRGDRQLYDLRRSVTHGPTQLRPRALAIDVGQQAGRLFEA